jgi:hypothetical protein
LRFRASLRRGSFSFLGGLIRDDGRLRGRLFLRMKRHRIHGVERLRLLRLT